MEEKILYTEQQKFTQWWIWLLLIALNGIFVYGIYQQIYTKVPFGDNPTSNTGLFIGFGGMLFTNRSFLYS